MKKDNKKSQMSKVGQYYIQTETKCKTDGSELMKEIDGEAYCVPFNCGTNKFFNTFSRSCETCPIGKELEMSAFPLLENCKDIECPNGEIFDIVENKCKKLDDVVKNIEQSAENNVLNFTDLSNNEVKLEYVIYRDNKAIYPIKESDIYEPGSLMFVENPLDGGKEVKVQPIIDGKLADLESESIEVIGTLKSFVLEKGGTADIIAGYPQLAAKMNEITNDPSVVDANAVFANMINNFQGVIDEANNEIIQMGGYPIDGNTKSKPSYMPTLIVNQIDIVDTQRGGGTIIPPMQKEELGANRIMNFLAPVNWHRIKENVSRKKPNLDSRGAVKRNSTLIGGVALFIGFVIFTSLLVNQFNQDVKNAPPEKLKDVFLDKTGYYTYSIIFTGLALLLFAALLFYAATSETGSKFISILLIVLSAVIILAALSVILKDKIAKYVKNNPYIKFVYHALFVIPCLFVDMVNYIYYEFKNSPKIVFIVFAIEVAIILSLLLIPALRNTLYVYISNEKGKKNKVEMEINSLKIKKEKLKQAIKRIKKFNPKRDALTRIDLNTANEITTVKVKKNEESGMFEEEITPESTDIFGTVKRFILSKKDTIISAAKKINPIGEPTFATPGLNDYAWTKIKKEQLDKKFNEIKLKELLYSYGYKSIEECDALMSRKQVDKCRKTLGIMLKHIQMNAKNIIIFNTVIAEIDEKIERLKKVKKRAGGAVQKGTVVLNKPVYFRYQKFIPIENINKTQVEQLKYNYSVSCWFFVHSQAPNYAPGYGKETKILSYNGEPSIYYVGNKNKLIIKSKRIIQGSKITGGMISEALANIKKKELKIENFQKEIMEEKKKAELQEIPRINNNNTDTEKILLLEKKIMKERKEISELKAYLEDGKNENVVIYAREKFKLQRWHNLVVNYVGGTVDVFLNGELVASVKRIVSFKLMNRLTVGDTEHNGRNGIGGGICNIVYYPNYISKSKIMANYNTFKDKNPPTI